VGVPLWIANSANWSFDSLSSAGTLSTGILPAAPPRLVRYKETAACFWTQWSDDNIYWSYFNNTLWTPQARITNVSGSLLCCVGDSNDDTLYLSASKKIYKFYGSSPAEDITPPGGKGGILSRSGNLLLNFWQDTLAGKYNIYYCIRDLNAQTWGNINILSSENHACNLASTQYAPDNFVPVAWAYSSAYAAPVGAAKWIKTTRIPTNSSTAIMERTASPLHLALLQTRPNPASGCIVVEYQLPAASVHVCRGTGEPGDDKRRASGKMAA